MSNLEDPWIFRDRSINVENQGIKWSRAHRTMKYSNSFSFSASNHWQPNLSPSDRSWKECSLQTSAHHQGLFPKTPCLITLHWGSQSVSPTLCSETPSTSLFPTLKHNKQPAEEYQKYEGKVYNIKSRSQNKQEGETALKWDRAGRKVEEIHLYPQSHCIHDVKQEVILYWFKSASTYWVPAVW